MTPTLLIAEYRVYGRSSVEDRYFAAGNNRATCRRTCHFGYGRSRGWTAL